MRYWLTNYELTWPRLEHFWESVFDFFDHNGQYFQVYDWRDNILKRQTAEEDNKTQSKRLKGKVSDAETSFILMCGMQGMSGLDLGLSYISAFIHMIIINQAATFATHALCTH